MLSHVSEAEKEAARKLEGGRATVAATILSLDPHVIDLGRHGVGGEEVKGAVAIMN